MTDAELEKINAERRRQGRSPLTRAQAQQARSEHRGSDYDFWHFAVAYAPDPSPSYSSSSFDSGSSGGFDGGSSGAP